MAACRRDREYVLRPHIPTQLYNNSVSTVYIYSLRLGEGQNVTYDLPTLEKHILNRFIYGKPLILSDIPQVQYRKDVYTSSNFAVIRRTVEPQVTPYY